MTAESVEFYHGEEQEALHSQQMLDSTIEAYLVWMKASLPLICVLVAQVPPGPSERLLLLRWQVLLGGQIAIVLLCVCKEHTDHAYNTHTYCTCTHCIYSQFA